MQSAGAEGDLGRNRDRIQSNSRLSQAACRRERME
jgi:hypothetical protein